MNGLHEPVVANHCGQTPPSWHADPAEHDLVVADASWNWTQRLFAPLAELGVRVLLLKACDWRTALLQKRPPGDWLFPRTQLGHNLWQQSLILPPGWMKSYSRLGMRPLAWAARSWRQAIGPRPNLTLAISYPHYLELARQLKPDRLVYYNMDDYAFYWKNRSEAVRALEHEAVNRADLSVFCARIRAVELAAAVPRAASRIVHLPHGAPVEFLPPQPLDQPLAPPPDLAARPRPYFGFVGTLEERVDWPLIEATARRFPEGTIVLIGRRPASLPRASWWATYRRAAELPNVVLLGWRPVEQIARYLHSLDACLIPYLVDHPFNRASSPTKLLDYMAASRPVVATALPECGLHKGLYHIAESHAEFLAALGGLWDSGSDDGLAPARWAHAREATWEHRAAELWNLFSSAIPQNWATNQH